MTFRADTFQRLLKRELRFMLADTNILLVLLIGPVICTLMFGLVYYGYKLYDVPIVVVDNDGSALSRTIIRDLDAHESITVTEVLPDESLLQRKFLNEECWGAVIIPHDFEKTVKRGVTGKRRHDDEYIKRPYRELCSAWRAVGSGDSRRGCKHR